MNWQEEFLKGTYPGSLDGFYKGELLQLQNPSLLNEIAKAISGIWLPWRGKEFYSKTKSGDNVILGYLEPIVRLKYDSKTILKKDALGIHMFPFKTYKSKGLVDKNLDVLILDYDQPQNSPMVRKVIDELVCIKKDTYAGKAYVKTKKGLKLVAFFGLKKA